MKGKLVISIALLLASGVCSAGRYGLTVHSRANCINNESITWDYNFKWYLRTISYHQVFDKLLCTVESKLKITKRSAAIHWDEGSNGFPWKVTGLHYLYSDNGIVVKDWKTYATDCNLSQGW